MSTTRRIRVAVYGAFTIVLLAAVALGVVLALMERERHEQARVVAHLADARVQAQAIAQRAVSVALAGGDRQASMAALSKVIAQAGATLPVLEQLMPGLLDDDAMRRRFDDWKRAHETLRELSADIVRAGGLPGGQSAETVLPPLLAGADAAVAAAQALLESVDEDRERRGARSETALVLQAALVGGVLLLLALILIEPMVRAVERRMQQARGEVGPVRRLAQVAENTAAMVILTDRRDRIRWTNGGFGQITGWSYDEAQTKRVNDLLRHPDADPAALERVREAMSIGHGLRLETLQRRKDGSDLWLSIDLRPLRDDSGSVKGFVYVGTDVTERVTEQARQRLHWLSLPVGVLVALADGRVVDVNRQAERLLGVQADTLLGRRLEETEVAFVREDLAPIDLAALPIERVRAGLPSGAATIGIRHAGGGVSWVLAEAGGDVDAEGRLARVVMTLADLTPHRERPAVVTDEIDVRAPAAD